MNITYLLGAGASYNALPIVEKIPIALEKFAYDFNPQNYKDSKSEFIITGQRENIISKYLNKNPNQKLESIVRFYEDIVWLKDEAENHTSIDTFAKKLFLQRNNDLKKLKLILSCFFLYLQTKPNGFDKRYDSFFASILDDLSTLPNNIKILSWNYDSQLEIAFSRFTNSNIHDSKKTLNLHSKGDVIYDSYHSGMFCTYKINGTTNVNFGKSDEASIISDFSINEFELVENFLDNHMKLDNDDYNPSLSFAWENNVEENFYQNLSKSIEETEVLIVIGYSFPFFNRKVDKFILDALPKLKKVIVQDPKHASDIIEKMKGLIPRDQVIVKGSQFSQIHFEEKTFTDQFFIPIEF